MYSNVYAAPLPNIQSVIEIFEVMILKINQRYMFLEHMIYQIYLVDLSNKLFPHESSLY